MERVYDYTYIGRWTCVVSHLLVGILVVLITGCTTFPPGGMDHVSVTPTVFSWGALQQRHLHIPSLRSGTPCPTTPSKQAIPGFSDFLLGNGPVYADFFGGNAGDSEHSVLRYVDAQSFEGGTSGWGGQKVLWFIDPAYKGPALIRGERLDGSGQVRFDSELDEPDLPTAHTLLTALRIFGGGGSSPWPNWASNTRLQMPGCYAYQVDGLGFSYLIIFKAVAVHITIQQS
jgi:hypothetical protein